MRESKSRSARFVLLVLSCLSLSGALIQAQDLSEPHLPALQEAKTISPLDGAEQRIRYWAPSQANSEPVPLFVFLHSWSGDYTQDNSKWLKKAVEQNWVFLHPDFRGINNSPKACGSRFARQDILDAIAWARSMFSVDSTRIYLAGVSGGGHMAMLMAGHHPDEFSAVSAWVGISDLKAWHEFHSPAGKLDRYGQMIEASLGGPPGSSPEIDAQYADRSPIHHIHQSADLPVHIYAGVEDGHSGSVPVRHSLLAFNEIAKAHHARLVSEEEMNQLWIQKKLESPTKSDLETPWIEDRAVLLRRHAGPSSVTIFQGGHESLCDAAITWLKQHQRPVKGSYAKP